MNTEAIWHFLSTQGADFGLKVLGALAAWIIGRWLIGLVVRLLGTVLARGSKVDATLAEYLKSILTVLLNIVLVMAILDIFGVSTTSFAALLAGAGLAIGTAWGGLLTHFAAGVFLQVLRPYKVGDFVSAGGVTGTVRELGLFGTTIVTPDNVVTIVGNNKVFSDTIQNFSTLPVRRVDCVAKVANGVDVQDAITPLKAPCSACAPTPTPTITGRCISTPTRRWWPPLARQATRCPRPRWRTATCRPDQAPRRLQRQPQTGACGGRAGAPQLMQ